MPYYDLRCADCAEEINIKASVAERSNGNLRCPKCGSTELETIYKKVNILRYRDKSCDVCPGSSAMASGGCPGGACGLSR